MPKSKQFKDNFKMYTQIIREAATFLVLALCLVVSLSTSSREQSQSQQIAYELRRVQDYTDNQVLQSNMAMLDLVSGLSKNTETLAHITCLASSCLEPNDKNTNDKTLIKEDRQHAK